jgi:tripartite-type tricarboxylate transporter receptor subunit TctC
MRGGRLGAALGLAALLAAGPACAQTWPSKPIQWIVPFAAGGSTDTVARLVGDKLSERLGVPVLVVNKAGANGDIGAELVAVSPPDGHTILLTVPSLVTNRFYFKQSADPARFAPVINLAQGSYVLLASNKFPAKSVAETVARVRANPGQVSCGLTGSQGSVGCEMLKIFAKADMLMVPYKGSGPGTVAVMSGEIDLVFNFSITAQPLVQSGGARAIASTGLTRGEPFPDLPTMAETLPGFELIGYDGVVVPRATPAETIAKMNAAFNAVLVLPAVQQKLAEGGLKTVGGTAEEFAARLKSDETNIGRVLIEAGVQPE